MCPRHVVALALVVWYLMVPPSTLPPGVAYKEPLSKWQIVRGFDTADDCRDFLGTFSEDSKQKQALNTADSLDRRRTPRAQPQADPAGGHQLVRGQQLTDHQGAARDGAAAARLDSDRRRPQFRAREVIAADREGRTVSAHAGRARARLLPPGRRAARPRVDPRRPGVPPSSTCGARRREVGGRVQRAAQVAFFAPTHRWSRRSPKRMVMAPPLG